MKTVERSYLFLSIFGFFSQMGKDLSAIFGTFLIISSTVPGLSNAKIRFQPSNPTSKDDVYAFTSHRLGLTNVALIWKGPTSGSVGCIRDCGKVVGGLYTWVHYLGYLPAGRYQIIFQADQCKPCETATLIVRPPCNATAEICDGKDNDCDGIIDENLQKSCYSGKAGTKNVGVCKEGVSLCVSGRWGPCKGERLPSSEVCGNQLDDDCDGKVDESCICTPGEKKPCYTGPSGTRNKGICKDGVSECLGGKWSKCKNQVTPRKETCGNGRDDDCDGITDENCDCTDGAVKPCYSGPPHTANVGNCKVGKRTCRNGQWSRCNGEVLPKKELCGNGRDDDCDGVVDNNCSKPTESSPEPRPASEPVSDGSPEELSESPGSPEELSKDSDIDPLGGRESSPTAESSDVIPIDAERRCPPTYYLALKCDNLGRCRKVCLPKKTGCSCSPTRASFAELLFLLIILLVLRVNRGR